MTGDLGRTLGWVLIVMGVGFGVTGVYVADKLEQPTQAGPQVTDALLAGLKSTPPTGWESALKDLKGEVVKACRDGVRIPGNQVEVERALDSTRKELHGTQEQLSKLRKAAGMDYCTCRFKNGNTRKLCSEKFTEILKELGTTIPAKIVESKDDRDCEREAEAM